MGVPVCFRLGVGLHLTLPTVQFIALISVLAHPPQSLARTTNRHYTRTGKMQCGINFRKEELGILVISLTKLRELQGNEFLSFAP